MLKFFPNPFYDSRFFHAFLTLFMLKFIVVFFSHHVALLTRFDMYYFLSFGYRILMFFCELHSRNVFGILVEGALLAKYAFEPSASCKWAMLYR